MAEPGTYLFAVAEAERFGTVAVGALPAHFQPVRPVVHDGLVAMVSTYSGPPIEAVPQNELMSQLMMHQRVIEQLMLTDGVLPVRLGAVLENDAAVESLLRGSAPLLRTTLQQFRGTVEIDVAATWDIGEILAEFAVDPEVSAAKSAALAEPSGSRSTAAVGVGMLVEAKLGQRRGELEHKVLQQLKPYANDAQLNTVTSDEVVCDIALLVERDQAVHIDEVLHRLDAELDGRFNFRCVGPLPPYRFATIHVHRIAPDDIERAMELLELPTGFDLPAILERYRVLALTRHPDVRKTDPNAAKEFEQLTWARSTLMSVCRNRPDGTWVPGSAVVFATVEANTRRN